MTVSENLIRVKREGANRSRRLAAGITSNRDRVRLLAYADELDAQADALEDAEKRRPEAPPLIATRMQGEPAPPTSRDDQKGP